jgi:nitrogen fixation/metabolism regulation signal transduction histidine kinase
MAIQTETLTIIVAVAGIFATFVTPLYYMMMQVREGRAMADTERETINATQATLSEQLDEVEANLNERLDGMSEELRAARRDIEENTQRSEQNQRHLHQLVLGKIEDDDAEIGNPHFQAEHCPIPDECPYCE